MSKGSNIRPYDKQEFGKAFDRIFGMDLTEAIKEESKNVPRETSGQKPVVEGDSTEPQDYKDLSCPRQPQDR